MVKRQQRIGLAESIDVGMPHHILEIEVTSLNLSKTSEPESLLRMRREVIVAGIRQHLHRSDDPDNLVLANHLEEVGDWAEADLFNDTDIAQLSHELAELREIDAALLRIKAGTYGVCADCGEPISLDRISAQPIALYCLPCQELFEKRHGVMHGASL